jgi:hypothetical protein
MHAGALPADWTPPCMVHASRAKTYISYGEQNMTMPAPHSDTPPPNKPMSIPLARALAEAADGFTGHGPSIYLVAPYTPLEEPEHGGFEIGGPYGSWDEVPTELQEAVRAGAYGFFGPFDTSFAPIVRGRRVSRIDLHVEDTPDVFRIPGGRLDALFFSTQAVEKFALPYYERIFGPAFAAEVMRQFQDANVQVMAHFPWSEYTAGTPEMRVAHAPVFVEHGDSGSGLLALVPRHDGTPVLRRVSRDG